jgi:precorrin-2 dehydrogenase/sirohydrochlorin ferrochelatase
MNFLPICVNVDGTQILIVGGGSVALQKVKVLLQFTRNIMVCAPEVNPEIKNFGISVVEKQYSPDVLEGALLAYACTNDGALNRRIRDDAHRLGILVNVADNPELCDFISPAIFKEGTMSVAVSSNGGQVKTSVALRNTIRAFMQGGASVSSSDSQNAALAPAAKSCSTR